jgi:hypothetical protein
VTTIGDNLGRSEWERLAELLREAAPIAKALFDDDTVPGALRREELRKQVGPQTYNELSVHLNSMRSAAAYERAKSGEIN